MTKISRTLIGQNNLPCWPRNSYKTAKKNSKRSALNGAKKLNRKQRKLLSASKAAASI